MKLTCGVAGMGIALSLLCNRCWMIRSREAGASRPGTDRMANAPATTGGPHVHYGHT